LAKKIKKVLENFILQFNPKQKIFQFGHLASIEESGSHLSRRGKCHDHYFGDYLSIYTKNLRFSFKPCYGHFRPQIQHIRILNQNRHFSTIFKITTGSRWPEASGRRRKYFRPQLTGQH
jgi:hypothetical protein